MSQQLSPAVSFLVTLSLQSIVLTKAKSQKSGELRNIYWEARGRSVITSCVAGGRLLHFSESPFSYLENTGNSMFLQGLF